MYEYWKILKGLIVGALGLIVILALWLKMALLFCFEALLIGLQKIINKLSGIS